MQVSIILAGVATSSPDGNVLLKATVFASNAFAVLSSVKLSRDVSVEKIVDGVKDCVNAKGDGAIVSESDAPDTIMLGVAVNTPDVLTMVCGPVDEATENGTSKVHVCPAASVGALNETVPAPETDEPKPHISLIGNPVADSPAFAAFKSSAKLNELKLVVLAELSML